MKIRLPFVYLETFRRIAKGVETTHTVQRLDTAEFDLPERDPSEVPVAASWTETSPGDYLPDWRWVLRHDMTSRGGFYAPLAVSGGARSGAVRPVYADELARGRAGVGVVDALVGMMIRPVNRPALFEWFQTGRTPMSMLDRGGDEPVSDTREFQRSLLAEAASKLVVVGREVWIAVAEPVLVWERKPGSIDGDCSVSISLGDSHRLAGKAFPQFRVAMPLSLPELPEALVEFGSPRVYYRDLRVLSPELFAFDPVARSVADFAAAAKSAVEGALGHLTAAAASAFLEVRDGARGYKAEYADARVTSNALAALCSALPEGKAKRLIGDGLAVLEIALPVGDRRPGTEDFRP